MTNEQDKTNKGASNEDTGTQGQGTVRRGGGKSPTGVAAGDSVLEEAAAGSGAQGGQPPEAGQKSDAPVGDPNWLFGTIWNKALEEGETRTYEPRDRMFATELGKAPVDVYLAMKGTQPTNLPNGRSKRKFEAGNMWEWIVGLVLRRAGVIRSSQERVEFQYEGLCKVSGRLDFIVGGKVNPDTAKAEIAKFELPAAFYRGFDQIVEHLQTKYPDGLADKPLEIKSLSAYMFDLIEKGNKPLLLHVRQLMHYMKVKNFKIGHIVYICRDDCRMMEFVVLLDAANEADYKSAIELRSGYYLRDEMPPLEKPILWDNEMRRFTKNNIGMAYSVYLTKLYNIKDQEEFDSLYQPVQMRFNRVLKRVATGAKMTAKNEDALAEMIAMGFDPVALAKLVPLDAPDEEEPAAE